MAVEKARTMFTKMFLLPQFIGRLDPHEANSTDGQVPHQEGYKHAEAKGAPPAAPTFGYFSISQSRTFQTVRRADAQHVRETEVDENKYQTRWRVIVVNS